MNGRRRRRNGRGRTNEWKRKEEEMDGRRRRMNGL